MSKILFTIVALFSFSAFAGMPIKSILIERSRTGDKLMKVTPLENGIKIELTRCEKTAVNAVKELHVPEDLAITVKRIFNGESRVVEQVPDVEPPIRETKRAVTFEMENFSAILRYPVFMMDDKTLEVVTDLESVGHEMCKGLGFFK